MSKITLYNEDCLIGMKSKIKNNTVDIITTSPPYNLGIKYNTYNDNISRNEYIKFIELIANEFYRILSDNGSIFLNIGSKPTDPSIPFEVYNIFTQQFILQNTFHWIKSITIDNINQSFGHFKPINSERYVNDCHEYIFHFTKTGNVKLNKLAIGVPYQDKSNIKRWNKAESGVRCRGNVWFIPYKTIQNKQIQRPHPASFPEQLVKNCYLIHGIDKINLAIDPFLGIGTSALIAQEMNINFIGFEIDKEYFIEANNRMEGK